MIINGVTYEATPLTFLEMTQLERLGGSINSLEDHMLTTLCAYVALKAKCSFNTAAFMLDKYMTDGGSIEDIATDFSYAVENAGFIRGASKREAVENASKAAPEKVVPLEK